MSRKLVSFDWAIKKILRSKANFDILEGFLSELLFEDITILEVLESESNKDSKDDKSNRIDIKVKNNKEEIIIIEIQYDRELDYLQRILYGTSKVITEHIKEGEPYSKITKVISINILYFDFGDGDDYIYKGTTSFKGLHNNSELKLNEEQKKLYKSQTVAKLYPQYYLIKVKNFNDIAKDSLDEWIYFLKNEKIENTFKAKGLDKAKEKLDYLKMEDEERIDYERFQEDLHYKASMYESTYVVGRMKGEEVGIQKGIEQGIAKGLEQGENQAKVQIVKSSLKQGLDIKTISLITGLNIEEIESIKKGKI
jgi:predicted transposase/invertase (TIGR01784 family)